MIRLPIAPERIAARVALTASEQHYLRHVLRLAPGDALEVFDGAGRAFSATLASEVELALGEARQAVARAASVGLAQALAKGEKMDLVVQKATELGASVIAPFSCERAVVKLEPKKAAERVERWQRIAAEAARQCGRADVPRVRPVVPFAQMLADAAPARPIVLYEKERTYPLSRALLECPGPALLVTGPEGGFTEEEIARAVQAGAAVATLGERILRTETVALAALALAQHLAGDLG